MHNRPSCLAFLVLLTFFYVHANDDLCPGCPLDWDPVCAQGISFPENTHANKCCELFGLKSPCIVRPGECGTAPVQAEGCPQLPRNIAPSHARKEQLADASTWDFIIDVRTLVEFEGLGPGDNGLGRIPGAILAEGLANSDALLPSFPCKTAKILVVCRSGSRSFRAVERWHPLTTLRCEIKTRNRIPGHTCVFNLDGGTKSWASLGYPVEQGAIESASTRLLQNSAPLWTQACPDQDPAQDDDDEEEAGKEAGKEDGTVQDTGSGAARAGHSSPLLVLLWGLAAAWSSASHAKSLS